MPSAPDFALEVLSAMDDVRQIPPFTGRGGAFGAAAAQAIARELAVLRSARGQRAVGRKIGFTNRGIWAEYGVFRPIWGDLWDASVCEARPGMTVSIGHLLEPRIEPEIVLGLDGDLAEGMDVTAIAQRIGWVAHGFEIVQSIYPGWRFEAADCIAAGGLHGMLLLGPRRALGLAERTSLPAALASLSIELSKAGLRADTGAGSNVLDGPVHALAHLLAAIAADPSEQPLRRGDMISTGTLTRAFPIGAGERWSTVLTGYDLPGLDVNFT